MCLVGWCLLLCLPSAAISVSNGGSGGWRYFYMDNHFPEGSVIKSNRLPGRWDCFAVGANRFQVADPVHISVNTPSAQGSELRLLAVRQWLDELGKAREGWWMISCNENDSVILLFRCC